MNARVLPLGFLLMIALVLTDAVALSAEKINAITNREINPFGPAELAAQLVIQAESQRSPMLMLAAADLLAAGRESPETINDLKRTSEPPQKAKSSKTVPELSRNALQNRALELAADDQERELVKAWISRPVQRGLELNQGKDLTSVNVRGVTYKVLFTGVIDNGYALTLDNKRFEGKKPAQIVVIGDGDGDLDLSVFDSNTGGLIGSDNDTDSLCVVSWQPLYLGPFRIKVSNVGNISERCIILANW